MKQVVAKTIARENFNTMLLTVFAVVALVLAAIGVYGVMAYTVERRTQEMGIRMALGAAKSDLLRLVLGHGMKVAAAGVIAVAMGPLIGGLATTYASWRWVFAGEVLVVIVILLLSRRIQDAPVETRPHLDGLGAILSAAGLGLIVFGVLRSSEWGFILPKPTARRSEGSRPRSC